MNSPMPHSAEDHRGGSSRPLGLKEISMSVVAMLISRPTIVMRLGANQSGTFDTSQHHQGCRNGSIKLTLVQEYLWSYSFFSCDACSSFCL
uniref:Uncharacterized protein n=1 Tax=Anopheles christyi TaxID=43041 RepID=A0A182KIU7_9DIPT